jgi:hypothetical protein
VPSEASFSAVVPAVEDKKNEFMFKEEDEEGLDQIAWEGDDQQPELQAEAEVELEEQDEAAEVDERCWAEGQAEARFGVGADESLLSSDTLWQFLAQNNKPSWSNQEENGQQDDPPIQSQIAGVYGQNHQNVQIQEDQFKI